MNPPSKHAAGKGHRCVISYCVAWASLTITKIFRTGNDGTDNTSRLWAASRTSTPFSRKTADLSSARDAAVARPQSVKASSGQSTRRARSVGSRSAFPARVLTTLHTGTSRSRTGHSTSVSASTSGTLSMYLPPAETNSNLLCHMRS